MFEKLIAVCNKKKAQKMLHELSIFSPLRLRYKNIKKIWFCCKYSAERKRRITKWWDVGSITHVRLILLNNILMGFLISFLCIFTIQIYVYFQIRKQQILLCTKMVFNSVIISIADSMCLLQSMQGVRRDICIHILSVNYICFCKQYNQICGYEENAFQCLEFKILYQKIYKKIRFVNRVCFLLRLFTFMDMVLCLAN